MRVLNIISLIVPLTTIAWIIPQHVSAQQTADNAKNFYDELLPYGTWVDHAQHGYIWIPKVDPGFRPYATFGYWVFTNDGWTWLSYYPWGWATFHYGRWGNDVHIGWFWVPDNEWGPAWVIWKRSPGYYGWAPLSPGISVTVAFGNEYDEGNERWIFVKESYITRRNVSRYFLFRTGNDAIIENSTLILNVQNDKRRSVNGVTGPDRYDVERATRTTVYAVVVWETDQPGPIQRNGDLEIYRPVGQKKE